jgi:GAF domain-containing protein/HAMP domain-containing protein
MLRNLSLRWRMILLVGLIPMIVAGFASYFVSRNFGDAYRRKVLEKGVMVTRQLQVLGASSLSERESLEDDSELLAFIRDTAHSVEDFIFISVIDDSGRALLHSDSEVQGQSLEAFQDFDAATFVPLSETTGEPGHDDVLLATRDVGSQSAHILVRAAEISNRGDVGVYSVVAIPTQATHMPLLPFIILGVVSAVTQLAVINLALRRLVLSPLQRLAEGAEIVENGNMEYRISLDREDELGVVARAFNALVARIRRWVDELEHRVTDRTAALARRNAQLEAVSLVGQRASSARNPSTLMDIAVNAITDNFHFYHAGIFVLDEDKEWAILRAASSEGGRRMLNRGHRLRVGQVGIVGYVAETGRPRIAFNVGEDAVWFNNPDLPETQVEMALPMEIEDEIVGVLDVQSRDRDAFSEDDINTLQLMADRITVALSNVQTRETLEATVAELRDLQVDYSRRGWARVTERMRPVAYEYDRVSVNPVSPLPVPDDLAEGAVEHKIVMDGGAPVVMEALRVGDQTLGYLGLSDPNRAWSEEELALVESVGEQVALALDNARLFEDTQRNERQQVLISRVLQVASDPEISTDQVLAAIVRLLVDGLGMAVVLAVFPNPEQAVIRMHAIVDPHSEAPPIYDDVVTISQEHFAFLRGLSGPELGPVDAVFDTQNPTGGMSEAGDGLNFQEIRQVLYVPMRRAGEQSGIIGLLQDPDDPPINPDTRELAQNLANQIAVVLENLSLTEETRQRSEELRQLYQISLMLSELLEPDQVLSTIVSEGARLLDADGANLWIHDSEVEQLTLAYEFGGGAEGRLGFTQASDAGLAGHSLSNQRTIIVEDYASWEYRVSDLVSSRFRGMMALPLIGRFGLLGVLVVMSEQPVHFTERDAGLAELFSAQAATALENARLNQATQRRAEEFSQLYEAGIDLITIRDTEDLLNRAADWARRVFEAERAIVFLRSPDRSDGQRKRYIRGQSVDDPRYMASHEDDQPSPGGLTETIIQARDSVLIRDNRESEISSAGRLAGVGLLSQMGTPLRVGDEVLGALFVNGAEPNRFGQQELDLLEFLAAQVSSALQNALQFDQTEQALSVVRRQARYQSNVSEAVALLNERGTDAIEPMLRLMAKASDAPVALYFSGIETDQGPCWTLEASWMVEGRTPERLQDALLERLPMERFSYWASHLEKNAYIIAKADDMPPVEREVLANYEFNAVLGLAVWQEDRPSGFIGLFRNRSVLWDQQELVILQTAAVALSNTIARERLFDRVRQTLDETEALYRGSAALSEARSYQDVLNSLMSATVLGQDGHDASLHIFDQPWTSERPAQYSDLVAFWSVEPMPEVRERFYVDRFPTAKTIMQAGEPHFAEDLSEDTVLGRRAKALFGRVMGAKSVVIVPLVVGGQRLGYLHANYDHVQTFSEDQRRRLGSLAQQAAIVVMNIRQLRATQARVRREQLIRQITGRIQEAPDVDGVLQTAIRELGRAFGTSRNRIQFRPPQRTDEDGGDDGKLDGDLV